MLRGGDPEPVDDPADMILGGLNPFRDLDLLFTRQQRDLAHLLQVHPHRIVEDIEA